MAQPYKSITKDKVNYINLRTYISAVHLSKVKRLTIIVLITNILAE